MSNEKKDKASGATLETSATGAGKTLDALKLDSTGFTRIGSSELVRVGDRLGVFTPVSTADEPEASEKNLETIVDILKSSLAEAEEANLDLKRRLSELEQTRKRTPDDFATAVSHSLDTLQSRLADMKNPVSRFAVKELTIDASVYVDVSPLGTIDYRFVQPGDDLDTSRLSRISMNLVPLPKQGDAGTWTQPAFTPLVDVEEIQGIGKSYQRKLNEQQIYTVADLLSAGTRLRSNAELSALLGVDRDRLALWLANAELLTIKEIDGHTADVLVRLGIENLERLAGEDPQELTRRYNKEVTATGYKTLHTIEQDQARRWIETAKVYAGKREESA